MTREPLHIARRAGFTLVELLVVIAIIAILFSLTSAAVVKVISAADDTANRTDIGKLEVAVGTFREHYKVPYLPSRFRLYETIGSYNPNDQLDKDSLTFLKQMWPQLGTGVDWNGDGSVGGGPWLLDGDQCLVFFLGGIPTNNGSTTTGFSTNPRDPSYHTRAPGLNSETVQPFYEFKSNRLARIRPGNPFPSYLDQYGRADGNGNRINTSPPYQPYAYFSSSKAGNDYNRYVAILGHDCRDLTSAGLTDGPYIESNNPRVYHNRNGFQIISAGLDRQFGPGGLWSPATAASMPANGRDDMANFYETKLGSGR